MGKIYAKGKISIVCGILLVCLVASCSKEPEKIEQVTIITDISASELSWNSTARNVVAGILGEIPEVGGLLAGLTDVLWPTQTQDVWAQIKGQVEALIGKDIASLVYKNVQTQLGSVSSELGLSYNIKNYLADPAANFSSTNSVFISAGPYFQEAGYELLLLPLFVQFANLHLALLRDGVLKGWVTAAQFQQRLSIYQTYAQQWYLQGYENQLAINSSFNAMNTYVRGMDASVMDFVRTWQYFDPTLYPNGATPINNKEIYDTLSGYMGLAGGNYLLHSAPTGPISQIQASILNDYLDNRAIFQGTTVNYTNGGLGNCTVATPAYPIRCVCPTKTGAGSCYIQVGGLDPNAVDVNGDYINNIADTQCCSNSNTPAAQNSGQCRFFDTMAECEAGLTANVSSSSAFTGIAPNLSYPTMSTCNTNNNYWCRDGISVNVTESNPIVAVSGLYDTAGGIYYLNFTFEDGTSTGTIPPQTGNSGYTNTFTFDHSGCGGYYLSSIFVNGPTSTYYSMAQDVVFGWKLRPIPAQGCPTPTPTPQFLGCYGDSSTARLFTTQLGNVSDTACLAAAKAAGSPYMGFEYWGLGKSPQTATTGQCFISPQNWTSVAALTSTNTCVLNHFMSNWVSYVGTPYSLAIYSVPQ